MLNRFLYVQKIIIFITVYWKACDIPWKLNTTVNSCLFHNLIWLFKFKLPTLNLQKAETLQLGSILKLSCRAERVAMNLNLIMPFMIGGTKTPCKLRQTCIFQQLDGISVYELFLSSGMKVFKGKTVYKINVLIRNIQYSSGTGA